MSTEAGFTPPEAIEYSNQSEAGPAIDTTNEQLYGLLERTGFLDLLQDSQKFDEYLDQLEFDDFQSLLTRINGILRQIPTSQRTQDGVGVTTSHELLGTTYIPPNDEDKAALMEHAFEGIKVAPTYTDKGLILYLALQAIHPFDDGNGRTGRVGYRLLKSIDDKTAISKIDLNELVKHEDNEAMGKIGRKQIEEEVKKPEIIYRIVNRAIGRKMLGQESKQFQRIYSGLQSGEVGIPNESIDDQTKRQLARALSEDDGSGFTARDIAMLRFIQQTSKNSLLQPSNADQDVLIIDGPELLEQLTQSDAEIILDEFRKQKLRFVQIMIDVIAHPTKYPSGEGYAKDLFYTPQNNPEA